MSKLCFSPAHYCRRMQACYTNWVFILFLCFIEFVSHLCFKLDFFNEQSNAHRPFHVLLTCIMIYIYLCVCHNICIYIYIYLYVCHNIYIYIYIYIYLLNINRVIFP